MKNYFKRGEPMVLVSGATLAVILFMTLTLMAVILGNSLGYFWVKGLVRLQLTDGSLVMGQLTDTERHALTDAKRQQLKVGNRDLYAQDFRWVDEAEISGRDIPEDAYLLERREHGNFFGFLKELKDINGAPVAADHASLLKLHREVLTQKEDLAPIKSEMSRLNQASERLRLKILKLEYHDAEANSATIARLSEQREQLTVAFDQLLEQLNQRQSVINQASAVFSDANGTTKELALQELVRIYQPNRMSVVAKAGAYLVKIKELLLDDPRESNTEGGLFPAIFGTVMMVLLMSVFSLPFGVIAAIYLREYAKEGKLVQLVRIAVNNLAGVPSIVYGVFGLGFFVYGIGGSLDKLFFPERLPTPVFGTGGILWASLTLALLTVPVVIVATEESLASIPKGIREGSLALGATKFQTLTRVLLPMATPGIMTGLVLSMARAVGEVAPLMMVGVVKLAPTLPFDGQFPFFHMDRKFMHLGFHIFDVGFQSPNVEAAKPMVYVTTLLLLLIVIAASSLAIRFRNQMRRKYTSSHF
ncbi:phosphate ABC transporter permease PstA [Trichlorobacter sp.]|uniref:phosphate ABC transporter permease PstA n=1 Tax=Trichlorobacter sp. TaxID=2911007 RepID=UPI002A362601|nr:phosphate ABC transporter permease PstA [Trichlorobacter sp.]MDY0385027.1 phosphate ABC transporter permease PstA [Trichlorobacter sp.]